MFSLAKSCSYGSCTNLRILLRKSIQPRAFFPAINSVISFADACNPNPGCGGKNERIRKSCGPKKRKDSCGSKKGKSGGGGHQICYKEYVERPIIDHDKKNMALKRPMSPHLTIFTMTTPAAMSIVQRITGTILVSYALLLAGGVLFLQNGIETYVSIIQSLDLSRMTVFILKILIGLPFAYHYFNGIRFCIWNTARFLTLKDVSFTATVALAASIGGAVAFAYLF